MDFPRPTSFGFQLKFEYESVRFYPGLSQTSFLWFSIETQIEINLILSWDAQTNFLSFSIEIQIEMKFYLGLPHTGFL